MLLVTRCIKVNITSEGIFLHSGTTRYFFFSSYRRITCSLFLIVIIPYSVWWVSADLFITEEEKPETYRMKLNKKNYRVRKWENGNEKKGYLEITYETRRPNPPILRASTVPYMVYTYISFSPSILQGITKGSYQLRSANPRGIVSYGRADVVAQDAVISSLTCFSHAGWKPRIRVSGKNSVTRLTRYL